jgi:hypothetical protein
LKSTPQTCASLSRSSGAACIEADDGGGLLLLRMKGGLLSLHFLDQFVDPIMVRVSVMDVASRPSWSIFLSNSAHFSHMNIIRREGSFVSLFDVLKKLSSEARYRAENALKNYMDGVMDLYGKLRLVPQKAKE